MSRFKLLVLFSLIIIIPIGFLTKFYSGPAQDWVNNSLGGLFYEIFWILLFAFLFPKIKPVKIALLVFCITCMLEFLQWWHPPFLEVLRANFIGRTILGNSFNWMDFPYYAIGSFLGWYILLLIKKIPDTKSQTSDQQPS